MKSEIKFSPFSTDKRLNEPYMSLLGPIPDYSVEDKPRKPASFHYEQEEQENYETPQMAKKASSTTYFPEPQQMNSDPN